MTEQCLGWCWKKFYFWIVEAQKLLCIVHIKWPINVRFWCTILITLKYSFASSKALTLIKPIWYNKCTVVSVFFLELEKVMFTKALSWWKWGEGNKLWMISCLFFIHNAADLLLLSCCIPFSQLLAWNSSQSATFQKGCKHCVVAFSKDTFFLSLGCSLQAWLQPFICLHVSHLLGPPILPTSASFFSQLLTPPPLLHPNYFWLTPLTSLSKT